MARPRVFVTRQIPQAGIDMLEKTCEVSINMEDRPLTRSELLSHVKDADGVIGLLTERIDSEFFEAARCLKGYANYAVGYDNIDIAEATRRKIPVSNTPGVLTNATAEMAWALLFALCRRVVESDAVMRSGKWSGWGPLQFIGQDVSGKTLGIIGAGRIGTAMALMSKGFSMQVLYYTRGKDNRILENEVKAQRVSFDQVLEKSDFVSIHTPLSNETHHLFDANAFSKMKPDAYLINTARGPVIDENALVTALQKGQIAGAGLDVYELEPKTAPGLTRLSNVVVAAHTGSATVTARNDMAILAATNLLAMLNDQRPPTCLNPDIYEG